MKPNRLGIFVFYDKDGIVDGFIEYFLKDFIQNIGHLFIVCNGNVNEGGVTKLKKYTSDIIVRSNVGYDVGAIKDVFLNYLTWDKVVEFDELVLCNSTFFGPLYPLKCVFDEMSNETVDFWGLTKHGESKRYSAHLQSYFLVVRGTLLKSDVFREFWKTRKSDFETVAEVIDDYEIAFTNYFARLGYSWKAFSTAAEYEQGVNENFNQYINIPYTLVKCHRMPVVKIKAFMNKTDTGMINEELPLLLRHIRENTEYNESLIWEHLIRVCDMSQLKSMLSLDYIIYRQKLIAEYNNSDAALFVYIKSQKFFRQCVSYFKSITIPIYVIVNNKELHDEIRGELDTARVILKDDCSNAVYALMEYDKYYFRDYTYFGFLAESSYCAQSNLETNAINRNLLENILGDETYLPQIFHLFQEHEQLGFLFPPTIPHLAKYGEDYQAWKKNDKYVAEIEQILGLTPLQYNGEQSFSEIDAIWGRTKILESINLLREINMDKLSDYEFEVIVGKLLIYLGQSHGYYSASVYSESYLSGYIENLSNSILSRQNGLLEQNLKRQMELIVFVQKFSKVYLYGAGKVAESIAKVLRKEKIKISGFVVSDEKYEQNLKKKSEDSILPISNIESIKKEIGIIVALNLKNSIEVSEYLKIKGFENTFYLYDGL